MTKLIELRCHKCGAKLCEFIGTVSIKCKRCKTLIKKSAKSA